jgi:hypothetical protein
MATEYSLAGDHNLSNKVLPQLAVHLLGSDKIESSELVGEGYSKRVWRVELIDGDRFIVKQCLNLWCAWNEVTAYDYLDFLGLDHSPLTDASGRILIFGDFGLGTLRFASEKSIRKIGWTLRRLHDGLHQIEIDDRSDNYLLSAIVDRAQKQGYRPPQSVPTHGDVGPTNTVVLPDGDFKFLIDFEEFDLGDPLADIMVACVEFASMQPNLAAEICKWLEQSYFGVHRQDDRFESWIDNRQRLALAESTLDVLEEWAPKFGQQEMATLYRKNRPAVLKALEQSSLA